MMDAMSIPSQDRYPERSHHTYGSVISLTFFELEALWEHTCACSEAMLSRYSCDAMLVGRREEFIVADCRVCTDPDFVDLELILSMILSDV